MTKSDEPSKARIVLAIEAAIRGGSVSLLEGDGEIASWQGASEVSRAEDLLYNIDGLLEQAKIDRKNIDTIAVSNGPGSYTGLRIGLATAFGLCDALCCSCFGVSALRAIAADYSEKSKSIVAVPMGRVEVGWQPFEISNNLLEDSAPARSGTLEVLLEDFRHLADHALILHNDLFEGIGAAASSAEIEDRVIYCGRNLALSIGLAARNPHFQSDLRASYVQNARFSSNSK